MAGSSDRPWRAVDEHTVIVRVRLTPKSSKDAVDGLEATPQGPAFKARVRAVPQDGAANASLERLFSQWLGVPKTSVAIAGGSKTRVKSVAVCGDRTEIEQRLEARLAALGR